MASKYKFRVARPIEKGQSKLFWSVRSRSVRQLFPSDTLIVPKGGNNVAKGKLTLNTAPHLGKRDIIEYLRKVYDVKPVAVNSMNYDPKLKRKQVGSKLKVVRTKAKKKFIVTFEKNTSVHPEERLRDVIEGEIVAERRKD